MGSREAPHILLASGSALASGQRFEPGVKLEVLDARLPGIVHRPAGMP
jgi:hypothetical protein